MKYYLAAPTLAARVSLSPDSPTQMFKHNFRICKSRIMFFDFCSFFSFAVWACVLPASLRGVPGAFCFWATG